MLSSLRSIRCPFWLWMSIDTKVDCKCFRPTFLRNVVQVPDVCCRSLLSAGTDTCLCIFDVARTGAATSKRSTALFRSRARSMHSFAISSAGWYPVDTGLLFTASMDGTVKLWDTNELVSSTNSVNPLSSADRIPSSEAVAVFRLDGAVYHAAMSPLFLQGGTSSLIACASVSPQVRLCDMVSGSSTHVLTGHTRGVHTVAWSPTSQFLLSSGSADGTVRLWDIRRAGCLMVFDQHNSTDPVLAKPGDDTFLGSASTAVKRVQNISSHNGAVFHVQFTSDGLKVLSSGQDRVLRSWDSHSGLNTLVNFGSGNPALSELKVCRFAVSNTGTYVFFPVQREVNIIIFEFGYRFMLLTDFVKHGRSTCRKYQVAKWCGA